MLIRAILSSDAVSPVPGTHTHSLSLSAQLNAPVHPAPRHLGKSAGGKSFRNPPFYFSFDQREQKKSLEYSFEGFISKFPRIKKKKTLGTHTHTRGTFDCIERVSILCNATRLVMKFIDCVLSTFLEFLSGIHCYTKQHRFYIIFKLSLIHI